MFLAPLDKGSKIEELVKSIRTRKGLKVSTIPGLFLSPLLIYSARSPIFPPSTTTMTSCNSCLDTGVL